MTHGGAVYLLTNFHHTTLYVGVTSNLKKRILEHKQFYYPNSFSAKYKTTKLVYYEGFHQIEDAIFREKQLKAGSRKTKIDLINSLNPKWSDLFYTLED